jgi:hypothetical protein
VKIFYSLVYFLRFTPGRAPLCQHPLPLGETVCQYWPGIAPPSSGLAPVPPAPAEMNVGRCCHFLQLGWSWQRDRWPTPLSMRSAVWWHQRQLRYPHLLWAAEIPARLQRWFRHWPRSPEKKKKWQWINCNSLLTMDLCAITCLLLYSQVDYLTQRY